MHAEGMELDLLCVYMQCLLSPRLLLQLTCGTTKPKLNGMSMLKLSVSLRETYLEQEKIQIEGGSTGDF